WWIASTTAQGTSCGDSPIAWKDCSRFLICCCVSCLCCRSICISLSSSTLPDTSSSISAIFFSPVYIDDISLMNRSLVCSSSLASPRRTDTAAPPSTPTPAASTPFSGGLRFLRHCPSAPRRASVKELPGFVQAPAKPGLGGAHPVRGMRYEQRHHRHPRSPRPPALGPLALADPGRPRSE